jgi:hypothetical protein
MREENNARREISEKREEVEALRSEIESLEQKLREARGERNLAVKEGSKEMAEVFKLIATISTGTAVTMSVMTASLFPDVERGGKLVAAYGLMLAALVGSVLMFLILISNVVDKVLPEAGGLPMAKARWFGLSFVACFCLALFGFLGGVGSFLLFVWENL